MKSSQQFEEEIGAASSENGLFIARMEFRYGQEEMLSAGQNAHAKRILDACDKLFRWGSATRGHLTEEQRERLSAMSLDEVITTLT